MYIPEIFKQTKGITQQLLNKLFQFSFEHLLLCFSGSWGLNIQQLVSGWSKWLSRPDTRSLHRLSNNKAAVMLQLTRGEQALHQMMQP